MSKLIYSQTSALLEGTYDGIKNRDQAVNPVFYSIAFTGDGYMYTHGRKFRLFNVINDEVEGLSFQINRGIAGFYIDGAAIGTGTVVQQVGGDDIVQSSTTDGVVSLSHATFLTQAQVATTYGSSTKIPIITLNESGHIVAIENSGTIDISKIRADATTTTGFYYPIGVVDSNLQNPQYNTSLFFDENGNIYANNMYINNTQLSGLFAPLSHTNIYATDSTYGHVILSDTASNEDDINSHVAATPKAVSLGIATANQYSQDLFAAQDAMVFVGTIKPDGTIVSHNSVVLPTAVDDLTNLTYLDYKVGWTFRFTQAGAFNGEDIEVGDMLIAIHKKGSEFDINDWTIIQTNISGALTAVSNLNGLLYANNSRTINSLSYSDGILKCNSGSLSFVNPNTLWRDIQINSTSIGTNLLNLISGNAINITENNGDVIIAVNTSTIIQATATLTIEQDQERFTYKPNAASTLTIGDKLTLETDAEDNYILKHATGGSFTNKFGSITTDQYGHITAINEISSIPNPNSIAFKSSSGNIFEYNGSETKALLFADGGDLSYTVTTNVAGDYVITPQVTHKYRSIQFYPNANSSDPIPLLANTVNTIFTLVGGENVSLSNLDGQGQSLPDGTLMINAEDTWRNIEVYKFQSNLLTRASIGSSQLNFGDDFLISNNELGITWTEIDEDGRVTYVK